MYFLIVNVCSVSVPGLGSLKTAVIVKQVDLRTVSELREDQKGLLELYHSPVALKGIGSSKPASKQ